MEHGSAGLLTWAPPQRTKDKTTTERMKPDTESRMQVSLGVKRPEDCMGFPGVSAVKKPPAMQETQV